MRDTSWFDKLPVYKEPEGFKAWMANVNAIVRKKTGVTASDLPDFNFLDEFEDGATPTQAAKAAIKYAKEF